MRIHIVQKGDTLYEIAKSYGVDLEDIVKLNPQLSSPDLIMPGMKIKIPSESKQIKSEKAVRVKEEKREAKTTERPMGEALEEEKERFVERNEQPNRFEPLYPVKPTIVPPKFEEKLKIKPLLMERKDEWDNKQVIANETKMKEKRIQPQLQYRPMKVPKPTDLQSGSMKPNQKPLQMYPPMMHYAMMHQPMNDYPLRPFNGCSNCCCCRSQMRLDPQSCYRGMYPYRNPYGSQKINHLPYY